MHLANSRKYRILIVDDHLIVSEGVELILSTSFNLEQTDKAASGAEFLDKLSQSAYDLVIMDINLPDTDTFQVIRTALQQYSGLKILIFSMHPEDLYVKRYMQLGVDGYLNKSEDKKELTRAVAAILEGNKYFSRRSLQLISEELRSGQPHANPFTKLTEKEFIVLTHLLKGLRIKEIASLTGLHVSTIGTQKQRILLKLGVKNMKELTDLARIYDPAL